MSTALETSNESVPAAFSATALAVLLERMPDAGLCVLAIDGRIDHWHKSAERLLGHVRDHISGQSLESLCPDERRFESALPRALFDASERGSSSLDVALLTRAGERRVCTLDIRPQLDDQDDVLGFVVLMRAAQATASGERSPTSNERLTFAHRMNLAVAEREAAWVGIDLAVRVTHMNDPAAERFNLDMARAIGSPLKDFLHPEDGDSWQVVLHRVVRATGAYPVAVVSVGTGTEFKAGIQILPLRDADGRVEGFTLALRSARPGRRATPTQSGTEDNHWLLAAAHDLREPLRKMRQYAGTLQTAEAPRLSDGGRRQIASLKASAERMQAMIGGMVRLARVDIEPGSVSNVDLGNVIEDVRSDLAMLIDEHGAQVHVEPIERLRGDADLLRALFQNLIDNSIRYRRPDVAPEIHIAPATEEEAESGIVVDYRDNARGIQAGEDVFNPLPRARSDDHGSGIGLPLCRRICRRHHGELTIHESDASGTWFRITLADLDSESSEA